MEEKINNNTPLESAFVNSNPENGAPADQEAAYYAALKRIENEKKRKRRVGCSIFIACLIMIPVLTAISKSVQRSVLSNEPITDLNIREVIVYAKQNGVDNANDKFRTHESGYNYRYKCIARYEHTMEGGNIFAVSIPYWYDENSATPFNFVTTRMEMPQQYLPADHDYLFFEDVPDPFENAWFLLDNVKIDVYVSNSGVLATPIIDAETKVEIVYSKEEAFKWLNGDR